MCIRDRVYHAFDRTQNVQLLRYDPRLPLFWSLDFNVNPMCSVVGQREGDMVWVLDELVLPDSNTWAACNALLERIGQFGRLSPHTTKIEIYGDATGEGRHSSASRTDWQLVREFSRRLPHQHKFHVPSSNPRLKDRVNCVNAMLHNQAGDRRLRIAPECKELIQDFERVH